MGDVTRLLDAIDQGDGKAASDLLPLVYDELRRLAASRLAQERPGQTLQATALVHEAWLRLADSSPRGISTESEGNVPQSLIPRGEPQRWAGRQHFFAAAATAMRRILVENARRKRRLKHGGELQRVDREVIELPSPLPDDELLALDDALARLAASDPRAAELVQLCFFAGLTQAEAAEQLGISTATAERIWAFTRAWLFREIRKELNLPAP